MGAFMLKLWFMLFPAKEYKIVVVGLDNAGKTTTLYILHLGEVVTTNPTIRSNVEEVVYKNIRFELRLCSLLNFLMLLFRLRRGCLFWQTLVPASRIPCVNIQSGLGLGRPRSIETSRATYYRGTHAVIVVIDSTDRTRISIMKNELFRLLQNGDLEHAVVLVFANKQDLKDAMAPAEITDALSLYSIKNHDWHIQACSALTGEGLYDGLGWIAQKVSGKPTTF